MGYVAATIGERHPPMEYDIDAGPAAALVTVSLDQGERLTAAAWALVGHTDGIEPRFDEGGVWESLVAGALGDDRRRRGTILAEIPGTVSLAPPLPGDVRAQEVDGRLYVQPAAFLASAPVLDVERSERGGGSGSASVARDDLPLLSVSGSGTLFLAAYGSFHAVDLDAGERYTALPGHVVAFEDGLDVTVDRRRAGGSRFGRRESVARFRGTGRLWLGTRSQSSFLSWLLPKLPTPPFLAGGGRS